MLENMKEKVKGLAGKAIAKAEPLRPTMHICMLGSRGVGKTSIITSLYMSQKNAVSGTNLFLVADDATGRKLDNKAQLLTSLFDGLHEKGERMTESGIPGDSTETMFRFTYGMHSEKINIDLEIRDYPGEYLRTEPEKVAQYVREADAVIIAIDTPCMMEMDGRYHEGKNRPKAVMDFLIENISSASEKLVLFVPLKCEKYYCEKRIGDVTARICEEYAPLIKHLKGQQNDISGKKNVCCAITPIQTLGGVEFDAFDCGPDGRVKEISTKDGLLLPERIHYRYTATNARYASKFCEQPLYYLLAFIARRYRTAYDQQSSTGFLSRLREMLRLNPKIDEFMLEIAMLGQRRLDGSEGYKILFGRGRIGG